MDGAAISRVTLMRDLLGYAWLIERYALPALPLDQYARLDPGTRGRRRVDADQGSVLLFEPGYEPENGLIGHFQFALRYEGVNLQVLALLFEQHGAEELADWILKSPESGYARRACFLYEWLTLRTLPVESPVSSKARYVQAVDPSLQFAPDQGPRTQRFRVLDNLPGSRKFCPLVRKTDSLGKRVEKDLHRRTRETLAQYDRDLLRRAAAFLYLKETQSSFEVEREKPSPRRAQRFADLLRQADTRTPLTEERLVELQNEVLDPRFHEFTWRSEQNWIGKDLGFRKKVDFVPARPEDLPDLMDGLLDMAEAVRSHLEHLRSTAELEDDFGESVDSRDAGLIDPVVAASSIAFGFVYIHPFMDGNGRIHRYLIHDTLAKAGFTPRGIVLPVSAVILANIDRYIEVLEHFSAPLNRITDYDPSTPEIPARGNDAVYFRYFDATRQTEFLYQALERTVEEDLQREIDFLLGFDRAREALNELLDWPDHSLDLFIRVVHQNGGELSKSKRKSHFDWMTDEEVEQAEEEVRSAYAGLKHS